MSHARPLHACMHAPRTCALRFKSITLAGHSSRRRTPKQVTQAAQQDHRTLVAVSPRGKRQRLDQLPTLHLLDEHYEQKMAFAPFANWLIPGHLMLGRYPYMEPSRCTQREKGERQVKQILEAGVTSFICLQEELPSQESMKVGGHKGFMPYRSVAMLMAATMSGPPNMEEVEGLRNAHLDRYLPARKKPPTEERTRVQLTFAYDPIVDLHLPDKDQMLRLVDGLKDRILDGEVVYMHCWGGRGRAGTIASCFLAAEYGLPADEVLERIQRAFDTRQDGGRRSPETPPQREFVRSFCAELEADRASRR